MRNSTCKHSDEASTCTRRKISMKQPHDITVTTVVLRGRSNKWMNAIQNPCGYLDFGALHVGFSTDNNNQDTKQRFLEVVKIVSGGFELLWNRDSWIRTKKNIVTDWIEIGLNRKLSSLRSWQYITWCGSNLRFVHNMSKMSSMHVLVTQNEQFGGFKST
jgi:hypothetical protein